MVGADDHTELRIYQPRVGKHPNALHASFVGKPVHVKWQPPVMQRAGTRMIPSREGLGTTEPVFSCKWFGYVLELDRQIPAEDLLPLPTKEPT